MIDRAVLREEVQSFLEAEYPEHYVVDVQVHLGNRIVVELGSDEGIGIDECVRLTKHLESLHDREQEDYELEVGSAGLTSPFKVLRQYESAVGTSVEVLRRGGIKEKGELREVTPEAVTLVVQRRIKPEGAKRKVDIEQELLIPMEEILQCKRVLEF